MNLADFSRALEEMAADQRRKDDAAYDEAVALKDETKRSIDALDNAGLLEFLMTWPGHRDMRMTMLNAEFREHAAAEALRRMGGDT